MFTKLICKFAGFDVGSEIRHILDFFLLYTNCACHLSINSKCRGSVFNLDKMSEKSMLLAKSDAKKLKNNKEYGKQCLALGAYYRDKGLLEKAFKVSDSFAYYAVSKG